MKQVVIIHGGNTFNSYDRFIDDLKDREIQYDNLKPRRRWKDSLAEQLRYQADVLTPFMPNKDNAVFEEWKIYFERLLPFLQDEVCLVGHSLGAMFLAKYLNEKPLAKPVKKLLLVAGGYDDETMEDLGTFKVTSARNVGKSAEEIYLFHSKDDPVVSFSELAKFRADLPQAIVHIFEDRGHFIDETFPEMLEILQQI